MKGTHQGESRKGPEKNPCLKRFFYGISSKGLYRERITEHRLQIVCHQSSAFCNLRSAFCTPRSVFRPLFSVVSFNQRAFRRFLLVIARLTQ